MPHIPEKGAKTVCGLGPTAAVHSGFSLSWETALKEAVYAALKRAVMQSGQDASRMSIFVTGVRWVLVMLGRLLICTSHRNGVNDS